MSLALRMLPYVSGLKSGRLVLVGIFAWLALVGTGMGWLAEYSNQAGPQAASRPKYTTEFLATSPRKFQILMFAHPHCPCTAASLSELARLMARCASEVDAIVYFYRPDTMPDDWVVGNLWNSAAAIPGVHVRTDPRGEEAARFGSRTSGEVLLYDASGRLCFHGGITPRRGHEGDNLGKSTVISIVKGDRTNVDQSPTFGCAIHPAP